MADELHAKLKSSGVAISPQEAARCYAVREFLEPAAVCTKWKAAEQALMQSTSTARMEEVMSSQCFEVGTAGGEDRPCLIIRARHQNPKDHQRNACLLSTLWACDAAVGSSKDASAALTVGYDFQGAGIQNFSLDHAFHFSRLFLNEYPAVVKDVYLISMPWALRQLLPFFKPLLSRRVELRAVGSTDDFVRAVEYAPTSSSSESFYAHVANHVTRASSLFKGKSELNSKLMEMKALGNDSKKQVQNTKRNEHIAPALTAALLRPFSSVVAYCPALSRR